MVELVEEGMGGEEVKTKQIDNIFRKFGCEGEHITVAARGKGRVLFVCLV